MQRSVRALLPRFAVSLAGRSIASRIAYVPKRGLARKIATVRIGHDPDRELPEGVTQQDVEANTGPDGDAFISKEIDISHRRQAVAEIFASEDVLKHSAADIGKIYNPPDFKELFPEGLAGDMAKVTTTEKPNPKKTNNRWIDLLPLEKIPGILIRRVSINIIDKLRAYKKNGELGKRPGFNIGGRRGDGKSAVLNHIVAWARADDWLVVFVPNAELWVSGKGLYQRNEANEIVQPDYCARFLQSVLRSNEDRLKEIKLKTPAPKPEEGQTSKAGDQPDVTLYDLCYRGARSRKLAPECVIRFREELSLVTEFPVLLAFDQWNALWGPSDYRDVTSKRPFVPPERIQLAQLFRRFEADDLKNGVTIGVATRTGRVENHPFPIFPKPKGSVWADENRTYYKVPPFNDEEGLPLLKYYWSVGWVYKQPTDELNKRLLFLSGGKGRVFARHALLC